MILGDAMKKTNGDTILLNKAVKAMKAAVQKVIADKKLRGEPLIIWRDGKVVKISPQQLKNLKV